LDRLTRVDQAAHIAWIATSDTDDRAIGIGRYILIADEPGTAEVTLEVVDEYQGCGVGGDLGDVLAVVATARDVEEFGFSYTRRTGQRSVCSARSGPRAGTTVA
jgi:hypothetical protein